MSSSSPFDHSIDVTTWLKKDRIEKTLSTPTPDAVTGTTLNELLFGKAASIMEPEAQDESRFLPYENFLLVSLICKAEWHIV